MKKLWPKFLITITLCLFFMPALAKADWISDLAGWSFFGGFGSGDSTFDNQYQSGNWQGSYGGGVNINPERAQALVKNSQNIIDSIQKGEVSPNRTGAIEVQDALEHSILANYRSAIDKAVENGSLSAGNASTIKQQLGTVESRWQTYSSNIREADRICQNGSSPSNDCLAALSGARNGLNAFQNELDDSTKQIQAIAKKTLTDNPNLTDAQRNELNNLANTVTNTNKPIAAQAATDEKKISTYLSDHDQTANACVDGWFSINLGNCVAAAIDWIFAIINAIIGVILQFVGWLFNIAIEFSVVQFHSTASSPGIMEIWKMIRDLTNIGFIFMLLYAGFMTLFNEQGGKMDPRKIVVNVFLFALMVNFSAAITRTAIDLSNVPALMFYNQMATDSGGGNPNISNFLISNSNVATVSNWSLNMSQNSWSGQTNPGGIVKSPVIRAISKGLLTMLTFIALIYILAAAAFNFLLRSFILLLLIMTSPIYFIAKVVPSGHIEKWSQRWMKNLKCWCLYAPMYMGGLYLVMALMAQKAHGGITLGGGDVTSSVFLEIIWFGLILTLLFTVDKLAKDLGCEMASAGGKFEGKMKGYGAAALKRGRGGLDYTKALPGRAANATVGRGYVWGASKLTSKLADGSGRWASSDNTLKRFVGRQLTPTLNKGSEVGFGTGESNKKRTEGRQTRHGLVMANMTTEQKAKYIQGMYLEGSGVEAYNSLSKGDKVEVQLAAQKLLKDGQSLDSTNIGKAKEKLKGDAKKDLEKQIEEQMRQEMDKHGAKRTLVDQNGKPILDENKKPMTEEVKYEAERNVRKAEFLMEQSKADRKIIYESIKNDKDRALLQTYLEQSNENQKKLIEGLDKFKQDNTGATQEQIDTERVRLLDGYLNKYSEKIKEETGKDATATEIREERKRMAIDFDKAENAKKLKDLKDIFADLKRELPADKRDGIDKEVKKIQRDQNKKEIETLLKKADTAATVTTKVITDMIEKFKGNLQDLGELLTNEKVVKELNYNNFSDLRGKNKGMSDNVLSEIRRMAKKKVGENASVEEVTKGLGMDKELVEEAYSGVSAAARGKSKDKGDKPTSPKGGSQPPKKGKGGDSDQRQPGGERKAPESTPSTPSIAGRIPESTTRPPSPEPTPEVTTTIPTLETPEPAVETSTPEIRPTSTSTYRERIEPVVPERHPENPAPVDPNIARLGAQEMRERQGQNLATPENNS